MRAVALVLLEAVLGWTLRGSTVACSPVFKAAEHEPVIESAIFADANPQARHLYEQAGKLCRQGKCEAARAAYGQVIRFFPATPLALQCHLEAAACCEHCGLRDAAQTERQRFIEDTKWIAGLEPNAPKMPAMCAMAACCAVRQPRVSQETLSQAETLARWATEKGVGTQAELCLRWQEAEVCGLACERRGDWQEARRIYEEILPKVQGVPRQYFESRLKSATDKCAASTKGHE